MIEEQGDAAQNQECAPKDTAVAPAAPLSLIFGACLHAVVNIAMDLIAEVVAELAGIGFILVTHQRSPIAEEPAAALYAANRPQNACRNSTAPMMMRISGQNDTKICRRPDKNPA